MSAILWTEPESWHLRPECVPHTIHVWSCRDPCKLEWFFSNSTFWKESMSSQFPVLWGGHLPLDPCCSKRYFQNFGPVFVVENICYKVVIFIVTI